MAEAETAIGKEIITGEYMEAAALRLKRVPMLAAKANDRGRVDFVFDDSDGSATEVQMAYRTGALRVDARGYAAEIQAVKALIFATKE